MRLFYEAVQSLALPVSSKVVNHHGWKAAGLHSALIVLAETRFLLLRELTSALGKASLPSRSLQHWLDVILKGWLCCSPIEALVWCSHDLIVTLSAASGIKMYKGAAKAKSARRVKDNIIVPPSHKYAAPRLHKRLPRVTV